MAGQPKQSTRSRKIEPLNWAETANSPALKGMMSFLDITSEEVRSGHFKDVPQDLVQKAATADVTTRTQSIIEIRPKSQRVVAAAPQKEAPEDRGLQEMEYETPTESNSHTAIPDEAVSESRTGIRSTPVIDSLTGGSEIPDEAVSESRTGIRSTPVIDSLTGGETLLASVSPNASRIVLGSVPSQNRKIRKCRLSQDGHSAGEEMLYRILWEQGCQGRSKTKPVWRSKSRPVVGCEVVG